MDPTLALFFMVISAALHAGWNVALRHQQDRPAASLLFVTGGCALTLAAALAQGVSTGYSSTELGLAFRYGLLAGASEGLYVLSLARAVHIGPLAAVYAVSRGLPLLVLWPASHFLLGEAIDMRVVFAVATLLAGLVVLAPGMRGGHTTTRSGYLWAATVALFNVTNSLIYKKAIASGAPPFPLTGTALLIAVPIAAGGLALTRRDEEGGLMERLAAAWTRGRISIPFGAFAFAGSFLIALATLRWQGAAWVLSMRNMSIAFAQLFSWTALGERPSARSFTGMLLVFAGALALSVR